VYLILRHWRRVQKKKGNQLRIKQRTSTMEEDVFIEFPLHTAIHFATAKMLE